MLTLEPGYDKHLQIRSSVHVMDFHGCCEVKCEKLVVTILSLYTKFPSSDILSLMVENYLIRNITIRETIRSDNNFSFTWRKIILNK